MKEPKQYPFITSLEQLRDSENRAALAKLRRGLGKKMGTPEMYPYVVPYLVSDAPQDHSRHFLMAAFFAMHPAQAPLGISFGETFRKVWIESKMSASIERRFVNLLSTDPEDIGNHLRHTVSLAKSRKCPIDYHRLFFDLKYWDHPDRFVQLKWAKDFYKKEKNSEEKGENQ